MFQNRASLGQFVWIKPGCGGFVGREVVSAMPPVEPDASGYGN